MIHILIGTRAQLIKMMPLMYEMREQNIDYNFVFMAQHRETIYEMLDDFDLKLPDYVLCDTGVDIVSTKQMIVWSLKVLFYGIKNRSKIFKKDKDGIVLIHGDAPPLFLGAVIAKAQGLQVGSIEAGLRSFNYWKPFPEEITRVLTAKFGLVDVFYCQDDAAVANVEAYRGRTVHTQGNTIVDAIQLAIDVNQTRGETLSAPSVPYGVVTLHRYETISNDDQLHLVVDLVLKISHKMQLKFILHPPTRTALKKTGLYEVLNSTVNIDLLPRMNFIDFNALISGSKFIVTDGGSNQEECAFLGIPCLLFRNETERFEGLGENVVLSKFDEAIIDKFVDCYMDLRRSQSNALHSPTDIILNDVSGYIRGEQK
jgi:UDP-N-acetylglucosamine 2-epimerase (non-hydrolysing)